MIQHPCGSVEGERRVEDDEAIGFLHELVATPSVSGDEQNAVEVFAGFATELGFDVEIDEVGNGIARRGGFGAGARRVVLLGHVDTVPGVIPVRIENGVLHGRGSVDAKGSLAGMLCGAAGVAAREGVGIEVVACVGEEAPESVGARHYLAHSAPADACIVGEPSGWNGVTLGYKGRLVGQAVCRREGAHSAGARGSAADELVNWWTQVLAYVDTFNETRKGVFETIQASVISWSGEDDGLFDEARIRVGFRVPPGIGAGALARELDGMLTEGMCVEWFGETEAYRVGRGDAVVRALSAGIATEGGRARHKVKTGTADLNLVGAAWGCPIAAYGPGDSALDHTPHERLEIEEYLRSIRVVSTAVGLLAD